MNLILYSKKVHLLKYWHTCLKDLEYNVYASKNKEELFEYFKKNSQKTILIMENDLIDKKQEEFLKLIKKVYKQVEICILTLNPHIKEGSKLLKLCVKGYGNAYMGKNHLKEMVKTILLDNFWYYPEFLQTFSEKVTEKKNEIIGQILQTEGLVLSTNNNEENIVTENEDVYEDSIFSSLYNNSFLSIKLLNGKNINIYGNSIFRLEKSVFYENDLSDFCVFNEAKYFQILSHLGVAYDSVEHNQKKYSEKIAKYSGNLEEYDIIKSNLISNFLIIKDNVKNRDGSDLVNDDIVKFIFCDSKKNYEQLCKLSSN